MASSERAEEGMPLKPRPLPTEAPMWKLIVIGLLSGIGSGYNNNVMGPALVRIHANQHFDHANDGVITVGHVKTPLTCTTSPCVPRRSKTRPTI